MEGFEPTDPWLRNPMLRPLSHDTTSKYFQLYNLAFRSSALLQGSGRQPGVEDEDEGHQGDVVNFCDFVRVLAHFRPIKKTAEKNRMNSREDKLRCKC